MALVITTPSVPAIDNFNVFEFIGPITISGSYVTNGVTFDLTPLGAISASLPISVQIFEMPASGVVGSGYTFIYALGTTIANGVIQAFSTGGTQAAQSTFASLGIANLYYRVAFKKFE
jgi:hypothetical protein